MDTSGSTAGMAFYMMAMHPEKYEKVKREIDSL